MGEKLLNKKTNKGSRWWGILLFALLVLIDQLTKVFADVYFDGDTTRYIDIISGDKLGLCISYNRGIAFGQFAGSSKIIKIAIVLGTVVLMTALSILYFRLDKRRSMLRFAIVLVVAGGVGNFIDRVYYQVWDPTTLGGVRDMVRWDIIFDFGVFNFADICISFGTVFLVLSLVFFDTDALFPLGKKYRALAKESDKKAEEKKKQKLAKKQAKKDGNNG